MKMKKYTIFSIVILVCISIGIGFVVQKQKNDLGIYFVEDSGKGDASLIEDLKYSVHIGVNVDEEWIVNGVGKELYLTSMDSNPMNSNAHQEIYGSSIVAQKYITDKDIISKVAEGDPNEYSANTKGINVQFYVSKIEENGEIMNLPMDLNEHYELNKVESGMQVKGSFNEELRMNLVHSVNSVNDVESYVDNVYYNNYLETPISSIYDGFKTYGYISASLFNIKLDDFSGKRNYGGVYTTDKKGIVEHLIKMDIGKKDILSLLLINDKIACVINENKNFKIELYNKDGTLFSSKSLENVIHIKGMKISGDKLLIYVEKDSEEFGYESQIMVIEGNEELKTVMEFKGGEPSDPQNSLIYKNGYLYCLRRDHSTVILEVFNDKEMIYSGKIGGSILEESIRTNTPNNFKNKNFSSLLGTNVQAYISEAKFDE